jgi:hypothetical protein
MRHYIPEGRTLLTENCLFLRCNLELRKDFLLEGLKDTATNCKDNRLLLITFNTFLKYTGMLNFDLTFFLLSSYNYCSSEIFFFYCFAMV